MDIHTNIAAFILVFNSLVFRFPGGSVGGTYNDLKKEAEKQLEEKGIGSVDWNALTNDAAGARTKEKILKNFYDRSLNKSKLTSNVPKI